MGTRLNMFSSGRFFADQRIGALEIRPRHRRQHQFRGAWFARNPYNTAFGTGGSSGGIAAALAASFHRRGRRLTPR